MEENPCTFAVGLQVSERAPFVVQKVGGAFSLDRPPPTLLFR
jgi:hypothetical protein